MVLNVFVYKWSVGFDYKILPNLTFKFATGQS
jgi:hypothetical protein